VDVKLTIWNKIRNISGAYIIVAPEISYIMVGEGKYKYYL